MVPSSRLPDWSYHPFFKPLLFRLPAGDARAVTFALLDLQSRTETGRSLFRLLAPGAPPAGGAVEAFGLRFPGPIGLAPGFALDGSGVLLLPELGLGFLQLGPCAAKPIPRRFATDPLRIAERHALITSPLAGCPSVDALRVRLADGGGQRRPIPIGVALVGDELVDAAEQADGFADFLVLPAQVAREPAVLAEVRQVTGRPILLRLPALRDPDAVVALLDAALEAGVNGCVAVSGIESPLIVGGEMDGPLLRSLALATVEGVARRYGDRCPVIGAGGVHTPEDALSLLDAGACLVELHAGLVYAGPGLPARINAALAAKERRAPPEPYASTDVTRGPGWVLVWLTGLVLIGAGFFAILLAATVQLLPYDVRYLGMTVGELCGRKACRIVHFMAHDRVSFGGSIISIGVLYLWLAAVPLRRGEPWSFWVLGLSGGIGFASFLTYLGYGYLDVWHGLATLALLPVFVLGLGLAHRSLASPRGPSALFRVGAHAWRWSPAGMGRALLSFSALGMIFGGLTIMVVGVTIVFVPTDLTYMRTTAEALQDLDPRLVPLIAHDRAGFGGGLCSGGLTVLLAVWCGARPGARGLWWALFVAGLVGFSTAIGIHPIVGYTSFIHLLPAYAGAASFVVGMALLHRPMCRTDPSDRFADL